MLITAFGRFQEHDLAGFEERGWRLSEWVQAASQQPEVRTLRDLADRLSADL